jgi:hypothetical protein
MSEELHKIRVYPEIPAKPGIAENLIIEIDGQKMKGITEFSYEVKPGQLPVTKITLVANTSIDAHSTVSKTVDNGMDGVSY